MQRLCPGTGDVRRSRPGPVWIAGTHPTGWGVHPPHSVSARNPVTIPVGIAGRRLTPPCACPAYSGNCTFRSHPSRPICSSPAAPISPGRPTAEKSPVFGSRITVPPSVLVQHIVGFAGCPDGSAPSWSAANSAVNCGNKHRNPPRGAVGTPAGRLRPLGSTLAILVAIRLQPVTAGRAGVGNGPSITSRPPPGRSRPPPAAFKIAKGTPPARRHGDLLRRSGH